MKNAAKKTAAKVDSETAATLAGIAKMLGFDTLETRNSDSLDFREISVWQLKQALEAAHFAGTLAAKAVSK
jgi:hypothetical protein